VAAGLTAVVDILVLLSKPWMRGSGIRCNNYFLRHSFAPGPGNRNLQPLPSKYNVNSGK
jgi:hypothetical protein